MTDRDGAVMLVGAGDAIGAAVARRFAEAGYKVCIARRDASKSQKLVAELTAEGRHVHAFSVDARQESEVQNLFARVEDTIGPIEVCLFNAGSNVNKPLLETTEKLFFKAWELACYAGFLVGREAARYMLKRGRGTMLFTGATASVRGSRGFAAFSSAKFGLRAAYWFAHQQTRDGWTHELDLRPSVEKW
jgi:NAD(P)-dependent dehydrogenase (short-subunit alcohol dehydrogenase family)